MKVNEAPWDRILRVVVGVALIAATLGGAIGAWGWIGVLPLVTGLVGWCPAYTLLGRGTCPTRPGNPR
jgi:hypothetical protein